MISAKVLHAHSAFYAKSAEPSCSVFFEVWPSDRKWIPARRELQ